MNKIYRLREDDIGDVLYRRIYLLIRKNRWAWPSVGAAFGLAGGLLSIILGLLPWAIVRFIAPDDIGSTLSVLSSVFFALSLPLLALGASCLDLLEERPPDLPLPAKSQPAALERLASPSTKSPPQ
jgi:hypothetical protein